MFCDLVGSTTLAEQLDPEELREVVRAYQTTCAHIVARYQGHIAQYLGDGLLVYFGYPEAHDQDARQAVLAGLTITGAVPSLNVELEGRLSSPLAVRVGIHTGIVVTGDIGVGKDTVQLAVGETPNVASRLQGLAPPNEVLLSGATHALVRGMFQCESLGTKDIRGLTRPVEVYRAICETGVSTFEASAADGLAPQIGREQELATLLRGFVKAREGQRHVVLLRGDAGMGKSRLIRALQDRIAAEPHRWLGSQCAPFYRHTPLRPIVELLERDAGIMRADGAGDRLVKLELLVGGVKPPPTDAMPLLSTLLDLPYQGEVPQLSPQTRRQRILETVVGVLLGRCADGTLVMVVEDLQWADPTTLEALVKLVGRDEAFLLVGSSRPEFEPPWPIDQAVTEIRLEKLPPDDVRALLRSVAGGRELPEVLVEHILAKTDGVPLFVEELTKSVLESDLVRQSGDRVDLVLDIPSTLQDSLMARLDRLGDGKEVAQTASVLGHEFRLDVLSVVSELAGVELEREIEKLVAAEIFERRGSGRNTVCNFRHALLGETAYNSLLKKRRVQLHARAAEVLEKRFPAAADAAPEIVGHHWSRARQPARAIPHYLAAGDRARAAYSNAEAIALYHTAIEQVREVLRAPEDAPESLLETYAALQESLGDVMALTGDRTGARAAFRQALAQIRPDDLHRHARLHRKVGAAWQTEHRNDEALRAFALADGSLAEVSGERDEAWWRDWIDIQLGKMWVHYWQADVPRLAALLDDVRPRVDGHGTPLQRAHLFTTLVTLGLRRDRYAVSDETLAHAKTLRAASDGLEDLSEIAKARFNAGLAHLCRSDLDEAAELFDATIAISKRTGESLLETVAAAYRTLLWRRRGDTTSVRGAGGEALAQAREHGMREYCGLVLANLAWADWRDGRAGAEDAAREAIACWSESRAVYPFQWTARLPLAAMLATHQSDGEVIAVLRPLLEPHQQLLPDAVLTAIGVAADGHSQGQSDRVRTAIGSVLTAARETGLL